MSDVLRFAAPAVFLLWGACVRSAPRPPGERPLAMNLAVSVEEAVENPEQEGISYLKIFVDGALVGQTTTGPKSQDKAWEGRLPSGNRLVRFEYWFLPGLGSWTRAPEEQQPRERFIRVEEGLRTTVAIRFFDQGRKNTVKITREPVPPAPMF